MQVEALPRSVDHPRDGLLAGLVAALGPEAVLTGEADRRFYSEDIFRSGLLPDAVVQPASVEAVQSCVRLCHAARAPMVPRGGGLSYSDGYLPTRPGSITFDLSRIDRILAVRASDMYVTVEAGCTWKALDDALSPLGLRTRYWGPISGLQATVGGTLSQNSVFWGGVRYGTASENVLGMDIVLADGSVLGVGSHAGREGLPPFYRHYGPELAGLFTGDGGAFGLKVRVTLALIPRPPCRSSLSVGYRSAPEMLESVAQLARAGLLSEAMIFDRGQRESKLATPIPLKLMLRSFRDVMKADGLAAALAMAAHGRRFLAEVDFSAHLLLEAPCAAELKRQKAEIHAIVARTGGWMVQPTIGRVLSARPFPEPTSMLAPSRFLPVNGILPHSIVPAVYQSILDIFAKYRPQAERLGIRCGLLSSVVGYGSILLEPNWHWDAPFLESHPRLYKRDLSAFAGLPARPEALALVTQMRDEVCDLLAQHGAAHLQIGKAYGYRQTRSAASWEMLTTLKNLLDPHGLMNPGALGLGI
jgi:FAD/FMN-containing dehydrogenase